MPRINRAVSQYGRIDGILVGGNTRHAPSLCLKKKIETPLEHESMRTVRMPSERVRRSRMTFCSLTGPTHFSIKKRKDLSFVTMSTSPALPAIDSRRVAVFG